MSTEKEFPYAKPEGSEASMFIQWKNTTIDMDFDCQCGERSHGNGTYAYHVQCGACGAVYEMGLQVIAKLRPELQDSMSSGILMLAPHDDTKWKTDWPAEEGAQTITFTVAQGEQESQ